MKMDDFEIQTDCEDILTKIQRGTVFQVLHTFKDLGMIIYNPEKYEWKEIRIRQTRPSGKGWTVEVLATTGRVGHDYVNDTFQVFITPRGGIRAYHGLKRNRKGWKSVYHNSRIK